MNLTIRSSGVFSVEYNELVSNLPKKEEALNQQDSNNSSSFKEDECLNRVIEKEYSSSNTSLAATAESVVPESLNFIRQESPASLGESGLKLSPDVCPEDKKSYKGTSDNRDSLLSSKEKEVRLITKEDPQMISEASCAFANPSEENIFLVGCDGSIGVLPDHQMEEEFILVDKVKNQAALELGEMEEEFTLVEKEDQKLLEGVPKPDEEFTVIEEKEVLAGAPVSNSNQVQKKRVGSLELARDVFWFGFSRSWWVPGMVDAKRNLINGLEKQFDWENQVFLDWTLREIAKCPSDLLDMSKESWSLIKNGFIGSAEVIFKECPQAYREIISGAIQDARATSDPFDKRVTLLLGVVHASTTVVLLATVKAPVHFVCHEGAGILAVPAVAAWSTFKVGLGVTIAVIYNVANPTVHSLRYIQVVASSTLAAAILPVADLLMPSVDTFEENNSR